MTTHAALLDECTVEEEDFFQSRLPNLAHSRAGALRNSPQALLEVFTLHFLEHCSLELNGQI
jgi:hypothetical protein